MIHAKKTFCKNLVKLTKKRDFTERKKCFLKQFSRIKFLGVIVVTVPTVSSVKDLPLKIYHQSKPCLIYPGFEVVIKCYNYDLEYKLKNTEEN